VKTSKSLVSFVAVFVAGFVAGIVFSAWKLERVQAPAPQAAPSSAEQQNSQELLKNRIAGLEKMLAVNPNNAKALVQLGNDYFDVHNYGKAIATYQKALEIDPNNEDLLTDLGVAYRRSGNPQEAVQSFHKALKYDPGHVQALFNLGIVLRDDLKDYPGALQAWETFLKKAPNAPYAVMVRPWVKQLRKKVAETQKGGGSKNP
jgi:cytochrome c-type biogenesis protein CcmH/NrfG